MLQRYRLILPSLLISLVLSGCGQSHFNPATTSNKTAKRIFSALPRYRKLAHESWPPLYFEAPIKVGMQEAEVPRLRRRLILLGDMQATEGVDRGDTYTRQLSLAVGRFQWRHGLKPDGVLGEKTLRALNVTPAQRLHQLEASMDRWAQFPEGEGSRYIRVNVANYRLAVVEEGRKVMDMRVVVGRPSRETPELYSKVETIVFNPKWNVPVSIARKDIIPKILNDPNYLEEHNIEVVTGWGKNAERIDPYTINWEAARRNGFPYRFTQRPGDNNALGRIKFLFDNEHDVYLHDTPNRELFDEVGRAFSSGCIRVAKPYRLVEYLIKNNDELGYDKLNTMLSSREIKYIKIKNPVPIYITYITAWVDKSGKAHFREDIYKKGG
ncbi:MAG: L,D-transpeptidase family protein [Gammaproteobacteria bacterium]|nr:L,D-transpeptidase family protein [Gammaproteobacteria bacterium]